MADMTIRAMLDDVDLAIEAPHIDASVFAIAGYVNGRFANWPAIVAKWGNSGKFLLSIDVQAYPPSGAQCLDIEKGDASIGQAPGWFKPTQAAGKALKDLRWFPKLYVSAGNAASLIATMAAAGIARNEYMLWTAHYGVGAHICGPSTCKYPQADATQYTNSVDGLSLDASLAYGYFFSGPPVIEPPKPKPLPAPKPVAAAVTWAMWPATVILHEGVKGDSVRMLQTALRDSEIPGVRGIGVDGVFGPQTLTSVRNFQAFKGLTVDGVAGLKTRAALVSLKDEPAVVIAPVAPKAEEPVEAPKVEPVEAPEPAPKPVVAEPVKVPDSPTPVAGTGISEPSPGEPVDASAEASRGVVYVQEIVTPELSAKTGFPTGSIVFIPRMVEGA